ncbi:glycosyl hydrolase 53 family protein [Flaviramulus sp. BrNp1-15]|uniref:glycosyl hydrolase 53 family protein n=1 Tax=Flaviramulus sp. BrNp1-15 TaxID=2916754 RepID=UPI001EE8B636|nr:glycosyl hydrolase 53 family protein [Flaviramulus sp. BrNp1-15]ULC60368.1 glycosyl hydrolase 53 family protein [Flaviramulus sp. BrNp1-15]
MKALKVIFFIGLVTLFQCKKVETKQEDIIIETPNFSSVSQVENGKPVSVMLTSYSTTLVANGKDKTQLRIAVTDSLGREITSASDSIQLYVTGKGTLKTIDEKDFVYGTDSLGTKYVKAKLENGIFNLQFIAGTEPDKVIVEAKSDSLWVGAHEIHTIPSDIVYKTPTEDQLPKTTKPIDRMIGADISFLPQIENREGKFIENGEEIDALDLLKKHGFNYIRLRVFVNPEKEKGYSPKDGFCDLEHTLAMAKRIKAAGMKFLLDFHYSDYWADPQKQFKPKAWEGLNFEELQAVVTTYTSDVLNALKTQGTLPDMVQVGNEINHGMIWPDGHIGNLDGLASLLRAGVKGVNNVDASIPIMMHIALGGQNKEAVFWLDNMIARDVKFDIIGLSYYPRWHGTLNDLHYNLNDLLKRYNKPLNVVEYNDYAKEVHDIVFGLPDNMGKGAAIWEPLGWRSGMFNREGEVNDKIMVYDALNEKYLGNSL